VAELRRSWLSRRSVRRVNTALHAQVGILRLQLQDDETDAKKGKIVVQGSQHWTRKCPHTY